MMELLRKTESAQSQANEKELHRQQKQSKEDKKQATAQRKNIVHMQCRKLFRVECFSFISPNGAPSLALNC